MSLNPSSSICLKFSWPFICTDNKKENLLSYYELTELLLNPSDSNLFDGQFAISETSPLLSMSLCTTLSTIITYISKLTKRLWSTPSAVRGKTFLWTCVSDQPRLQHSTHCFPATNSRHSHPVSLHQTRGPTPSISHLHANMLIRGLRKKEPQLLPKYLPLNTKYLKIIQTLHTGYISVFTNSTLFLLASLVFCIVQGSPPPHPSMTHHAF